MSNRSETKFAKGIVLKCIEELQLWMSNNPKYSCEFRSKAKYKDELYKALLNYKVSKTRR